MRRSDNPEKRAELIDHLAELRNRLVRSALYITIGAVVAWFLYEPFIYKWLTAPMMPVLAKSKTKYLYTSIIQPFMLRMQVSVIAGLILTLPLVTLEVWGFIAPGLRPNEKKPLRWVVPLSIVLFAAGVAMAYWVMPRGFQWFANYIPTNAEIRPSVPETMRFVILMLLAFGIAFELPVFLMLLGSVGILSSKTLKANWRYCVVGLTMAATIFCPSNDILSVTAMAIPLIVLYVMSIYLVKLVEKKPKKTSS